MVRRLAVLLCLVSSVPQGAWAAVARSVEAPLGSPTIPSLAPLPGLAAPGQSNAAGSALPGLPVEAAETGSATSFKAAQSPSESASTGLSRTAASAVELEASPAGDESDRARADFTQGRRGDSDDALAPSAPPAPGSPSLSRSEARPSTPTAPPAPPAPRTVGFLAGIFGSQVANNALNVTLPLALMSVGQSVTHALGLTALTTAFDMAGTLGGGWLVGRLSARKTLMASGAVRAAALAAATTLLAFGAATAPVLVALFSLDAMARGVADTARNTAAVELVGKDKPSLDRLNGSSQTAFYAGGIIGPLAIIPLLALPGFWAQWFVAGSFAAAAAAFVTMPRRARAPSEPGEAADGGAVKPWYKDRAVLAGAAALVLASLMPALRAQLPVLFADGILHVAADAAKLALAFGLGSTAGSLLYRQIHDALSPARWLALGSIGTLTLAAAWVTGAFLPVAAGVFVFAAASAMAQLAATSTLQSRLPAGSEGPAMGAARFGANLLSLLLRLAIPAIVAAALSPAAALPWIGGGLAALGLTQLWVSGVLPPRVKRALAWTAAAAGAFAAARYFPGHDPLHLVAAGGAVAVAPMAATASAEPRPSEVHGYPGRLIVVEGLDGSGKSTQLELLKEYLESQGRKVIVTSWNSSDLIADAVKKAKRHQALTPRTFALLNAADFADRVEHVIKPALAEGTIVLADRWFYTAVARDSVRGNDPAWVRSLYDGALKPDLALYFRLGTDTAIQRVLARAGGKVGLSEDFDESDPRRKVLGQSYYAAGRDMRFHEDDLANFREFQKRVAASYDAQVGEFGLTPIDASPVKGEEVEAAIARQHENVMGRVLGSLGPLESFKKAPPRGAVNIFDKDPANDDEKLRRNYVRPKKGVHFYFRNMFAEMRQRFEQLVNNDAMPRVFTHGNMHVDNYAKTENGAGVIDFDRARVRPYAWEIVRSLVSLSLRQKKPVAGLLVDPTVSKAWRDGYEYGLEHPDKEFSEARIVKNVKPGKGERSMDDYLDHDGKWAREMRASPVPGDAPEIVALIKSYADSVPHEKILQRYKIVEAGLGEGSMGQRKIYLVVLAPRRGDPQKGRILLNIKQSRTDPDTRLDKNPYSTEVERLTAAGELWAPDMEPGTGGAVLNGVEYGVRRLPAQNVKIKKMLTVDDQRDLAYAMGTQAGIAHARWLRKRGEDPAAIEAHLEAHYQQILDAGLVIRDEIVEAHERYLKVMKKRGLEPKDKKDEDDE